MKKTPRSFIREILKVTEQPEIISFAGGLPNPEAFPIPELGDAADYVINEEGVAALQYATTEGFLPLRQWIADRYKKRYNLSISPEEILITHGSQQSLDLCGKIFINKASPVAMERPGYLGAIQAFSLYEPEFIPVNLEPDGPCIDDLNTALKDKECRLFYGVPNSQNPSGITWSKEKRKETSEHIDESEAVFIEDDAYGEIRFTDNILPPVKSFVPDNVVMNGSFSKIVSPGMRMGWVCAPEEIIKELVTAKQATDLHSSILVQRIIYRYLKTFPVDDYIKGISEKYKGLCNCMVKAIRDTFPESVKFTVPDGGMFLWITLPAGCSSLDVFNRALEKQVAVLPGLPFYTDGGGEDTLRLNFTNSSTERIDEGIKRLSEVLHEI